MKIIPATGLRGLALREASPDLMRTIGLVRAAIDEKVNAGGPGAERKYFELEVVYSDSAVICLEGRYWSYAYTLTNGVVTLADPAEVMETFVPLKEAAPGDFGLRLREAEGQPEGAVWEATLIQAGTSLNGVFYSDALLREALPLFNGVRICLKSDDAHIKGSGRDLGNVVGWGADARFIEGATQDSGRIVGTLNLPGLPDHTRALLVGAFKAGKHDIAGLSIDAQGSGTMRVVEGKRVRVPTRITAVESVDLIVEPGAGGRLIRLLEAAPTSGDDMKLREMMLRLVEAKTPAVYANIDPATVSDEDLEKLYREAVVAGAPAPAVVPAPADPLAGAEERLRMIEARASARAEIGASNLPAPAKDRLLRDFAARERFVEADVAAAIKAEREYLSRFVEAGRVNMPAFDVQVGDRSAQVSEMLDAFFDPAHKDHRNTQSFRECYVEMTGDRRVTGRLADCDMSRLRESLGEHYREATMDSASFALALGDAINRRMLAEYNAQGQFDVWRNLANVVPVTDFKTQHRTRWGGFGDLPAVAEGANYLDGAVPGDEEATYKAGKVGRLATVTMEMIRNDDVGIVRQIPVKLARAAKRTLSKFVLDFVRANGAIYDGKALFHVDHANLGTAALSSAAWSAARLAIMAQAEAGSGERLGIPPKFLWVPAGLEEMAYELFKNRGASNDQSFIQTQAPTVIPVWYWTDANDWVASVDKMDVASVEIGFLDGREEPEIFVQDSPTMGSLFAADKVTYKIRHIYGGAVTDFRGLYKSVVA